MGVLIALALALVTTACYSPGVRDCALACAADTDCVQDQICTADHWCAAPALASGCGEVARDGGVDAPKRDARPDVALHVHIDGSGMVTITGVGSCDMVDCTFQVPSDVPMTLVAEPHGNHMFDAWQGPTCMNQHAVCTFTPTASTTASAKFK